MERLGTLVRKMRARKNVGSGLLPKRFDSFKDALSACRSSAGYEERLLAQIIVQKTRVVAEQIEVGRLPESAMRTAIALASFRGSKSLRVLDFGGAAGFHYFVARKMLGEFKGLRWQVVETPAMVEVASEEFREPALNFSDSIEAAIEDLGAVDLVFSSGAIHCVPEPLETLASLANIEAKSIFVTRTAFTKGQESQSFIQRSRLSENGPGPLPPTFQDGLVEYPVRFEPMKKALEILNRGFERRFIVDETDSPYRVNGISYPMLGYFGDQRG